MGIYTLNDLEKLTGIKTDTIRMWEQRYRVTTAHRTETNRRWYTDDDLRRLINISILNRSGLRISEIASMPADILEERTAETVKGNSGPDILADSLIIAMTRLDEDAIDEILLRSVIYRGFEATFSTVVFPFLIKVGVMWHTGTVNIGTEHFITNIFRRKLIAGFENLRPPKKSDGKKILLFLPENEFHELGLLYFAYILRSLGNKVLYLGQSTPLNAVVETCEVWDPDLLITGALTAISIGDPDDFVMKAGSLFRGKKLLLAGSLAEAAAKSKKSGVFPLRTKRDLEKLLK
ncbi:MAG TPA: helix-turn-helix-type transcriptional regulator [Bacteroidales bacterium]|jgi:MerR family transcriptional regulator, light-induced transcriptional regulator|nr:helix-turn-helix-type transcriptional regulator [Bacteroidales bacterium]HBZ21630.1 helix-turn-helix-type transcriptional regulator [Bacteroidales bacterium]